MTKSRLARAWNELRRRKVVQVAAAYAVIAWLLVEVASVVAPELLLPDWFVRVVIVVLALGFPIAVVLAWALELTPDGPRVERGSEPSDPTGPVDVGPAAQLDDDRPSIAVLPLHNLSGDPEDEYFGDGIATEILNLLCKLPQLRVSSRTTSFSFKSKQESLGSIASQLGVDTILEGSVRRASGRLRITAQLIDTKTDTHLWSESYDRELGDIFEVQDEIAGNIVRALKVRLTDRQRGALRQGAITENMAAYDHYLRGQVYFERGSMEAAAQFFERATEEDPGFTHAWAWLANCYSWICMWIGRTPENIRRADDASLKAMELGPDLAEAHAARGFALLFKNEYETAEQEFEVAMELDPMLYEAYYFAGRAMVPQGRMEEAAELFEKALEVRPEDVTAATLRIMALRGAGKPKAAHEAARHAVKVAERHLALNPGDSRAWSLGAGALADAGDKSRAVEWAERALATDPSNSSGSTYNVACTFAVLGEYERALDALESLGDSFTLYREWVAQDSDLDGLRGHPRYEALMADL